ncbi:Gfo/Idh/MocA family oxidoreductase [Sporosarcina sp. E16_3]|uniref:Gfo/Idh/MocA family protein n=1 Tax=Sporosarcina sp. E16_3 TaxID=2789293 RepID=UPI001A933A20|nr:Gfo/Idh/MocA family oxidoreductase [Sporosarcina sp. E16_3]MBO0600613.1 Gfo/Idh/MocA family oxidoreductase [Sporosarcina sp. E16_3]
MNKVKVAVIGIGKLGLRNLNIWSRLKGIEIVGIIGRDQERLQEVGEQFGAATFTSVEDLLSQAEVDTFDICTPTDTHAAFVNQIAQAKKHIICAKPLALTSIEAEQMIAICEQNNVQLLVGHTLQFFPEYVNAKEQFEKGAIGRPGVIRMSRGVPYPSKDREWYTDEQRSGGLFLDLGVHEFEWIQSTFGEVQRVMAKHVKHTQPNEKPIEYGLVTLRMTDGTIVHIELSWAETKFRSSFELTGNKGMITYNHEESNPVTLAIHGDVSSVVMSKSMLRRDPFARQLEHFVDCLTGKKNPIVSSLDALLAIRISEAAIKSAAVGQPVTLIEGGQVK